MEVLRRFVVVVVWAFMAFWVSLGFVLEMPMKEFAIGVAIVVAIGLFIHMIVNWIFAGSKKTNETKGRSDPDL